MLVRHPWVHKGHDGKVTGGVPQPTSHHYFAHARPADDQIPQETDMALYHRPLAIVVVALILTALIARAAAQPEPGGVCKPVSERTGEVGCWILAHDDVGTISQAAVFWHLAAYPTRAAAESAKGLHDTVVESLGKVWVLSIGNRNTWPRDGEQVAEIGPLAVEAGRQYKAQYMEAIFVPGMTAQPHTHSGPEA